MSARTGNWFRPVLEQCEAREVPAMLLWTGAVDTDAGNPWNWCDRSTYVSGVLPAAGDDLYFEDAKPLPTAAYTSCTGLTLSSGAFASIHVTSGYFGTVTFGSAIHTQIFELAGGAISQPTAGTDLTVTDGFVWTAGTLNSALSGANVFLAGATGTIDPGAGNSIISGSTLILNPRNGIGATLDVLPGNLNLAAGDGIEANSLCLVNIKPDEATVSISGKPVPDEDKTKIVFKQGAKLTVSRPLAQFAGVATWNGKNLVLVNDGGTVLFNPNTRSTFGPAGAASKEKAFIRQISGTFEINANAVVSVNGADQVATPKAFMELSGGTLLARYPENAGLAVPAKLVGNLRFSGGQIAFAGTFSAFTVEGNVKWTGGWFSPRLDVSKNGVCDTWFIEGELNIPNGAAVEIQPATSNYDPNTAIPAHFRWEVIKAGSRKLGPNALHPSVGTVPGNAPMELETSANLDGTDARWRLRRKAGG